MSERLYRLHWWFRGKDYYEDVSDVAHARARLQQIMTERRVKGATCLYCFTSNINAGKWFLYEILK
jgi:hypothetical protein